MNSDPRTYIDNLRNSGDLKPAVLNRLETYIRGWTAMENEDSAYRRAKVVFERFRDNETDQDKIDELNDLLDGMYGHLQFMIGDAQGTPEQIAEMQDVINTIDMLIPDMTRHWVQNQNETDNSPNNRPVSQGGRKRRTRKSKKHRKSKKYRRSRRYRK